MANQRRLVELATIVQEGTLKIDQYLADQGKPSPCNDVKDDLVLQLPDDLSRTRTQVIEASDELQTLLRGPLNFYMSVNSTIQIAFNVFHRFDVAGAVPIDSTATYAEIAQHVGLAEEDTQRLLRTAMTHRIFREPRKGEVAHTALSRALVGIPLLTQYLGLATEEVWFASVRLVDALRRWPGGASSPVETGYNLAAGPGMEGVAYFEGMKGDAHRARRFDDTMRFTHQGGTSGSGYDRDAMIGAHAAAWHAYSLVVDVGGGAGHMALDLARRFPRLRTVSQDLPDVVAAAAPVPDDLKDRVQIVPHDFFRPQPVVGADAYLLRWIFHDWADAYAARILRALIPALKKGAKILVNEMCLPEPGTIPLTVERSLRGADMAMKATLNGKERDAGQWKQLFASADPNFKILGITQPPASRSGLIEVEWVGESSVS